MVFKNAPSEIAGFFRPGWRRLLAIGLGVPLLLGVVLALGALISWLGDGYEPPDTLDAGRADDYAAGAPKLFEEEDVWVVRLAGADFQALYDRGVESGCPLQWRPEFEFTGRRGWFVDACNGWVYDLTGTCVSDECRDAVLDRFPVEIRNSNVIIQLHQTLENPSAGAP